MIAVVSALLASIIIVAPCDVPPQCDQQVFARSNPQLCTDLPVPTFAPSGGGGNGGLGGLIGHILHTIGL